MFSKKEGGVYSPKTITIVAEGVRINGKLLSPGSVRIDGIVRGEIISNKELIIGKEGKVEANVKTNDAIVAGYFTGDMIASGSVEITSTGRFIGNLIQKDALLTIEKGGLFKGESIIAENNEIFALDEDLKDDSTFENLKEIAQNIESK